MNFSAWSIRNPIPAILLFIMLGLTGLMCFKWMKIQQTQRFVKQAAAPRRIRIIRREMQELMLEYNFGY